MNYPHKCVRCGFCCLSTTCIAGQAYHGIGELDRCPSLRFNRQGRAKCSLVKRGLVPVGDGCCIKARAYRHGVEYDFAALPAKLKRRAVADARRKAI